MVVTKVIMVLGEKMGNPFEIVQEVMKASLDWRKVLWQLDQEYN
jgi:hypothetical protein